MYSSYAALMYSYVSQHWTTVIFKSSRHTYVPPSSRAASHSKREQGQGPYAARLKKIDQEIKDVQKRVNEKLGMWLSHRLHKPTLTLST